MSFRRTVLIIFAALAALVATLIVSVLIVRHQVQSTISAYSLIRAAQAAEQVGDLRQAVDLYGQSLQSPNSFREERGYVLQLRAKLLERLAQFDEAEADWSARLEIMPSTPAHYGDRGRFYLRRGAYDKALTDFAAAKALDRNKASYLVGEAEVFTARGEHRAAVERYTAALALEPANGGIRLARADAESRAGLYAEARDDYGEIIARHEAAAPDKKLKASEVVPVYMTRGLASLRLGDYPRAIADFDQVLVMAPKSADALRWRGDAYERSGDRARALGDYRAALALNYKDDDAAARVLRAMEGRPFR
jgi:tetratricopeptide (TPR) repeat protein